MLYKLQFRCQRVAYVYKLTQNVWWSFWKSVCVCRRRILVYRENMQFFISFENYNTISFVSLDRFSSLAYTWLLVSSSLATISLNFLAYCPYYYFDPTFDIHILSVYSLHFQINLKSWWLTVRAKYMSTKHVMWRFKKMYVLLCFLMSLYGQQVNKTEMFPSFICLKYILSYMSLPR